MAVCDCNGYERDAYVDPTRVPLTRVPLTRVPLTQVPLTRCFPAPLLPFLASVQLPGMQARHPAAPYGGLTPEAAAMAAASAGQGMHVPGVGLSTMVGFGF